MSEVYRALDTRLDRDVALKVLPPALANDPARIERFKREARVVASLNHPHIVTLYSVEEADGIHFLTMEFVEGETLEGRLPPDGLPVAQALDIAWAVADALIAAHGKGIVHRDLKPANVSRAVLFGASGGSAARSNLAQAEIYFKRALAIVPTHARALCQYGRMQYILANLGVIPREEAEAKGRQLVMAALAADDRAAEIHTAISQIFLYIDDDFASASRHADRAVALNPAYAEGLRAQSIVRKIEGRFDEAVDAARASVAIASTPGFWNGLGETLLAAGRTAEAVDALRGAISRQAGYGPALERMELALARLARVEEAVDFRIAYLRATGRGERAAQLQEEAGCLGPDAARRRDLLREVERSTIRAAPAGGRARGTLTTYEELRVPHMAVLQFPGPDGVRPGLLAERAGMSKQAMNQLLRSLEGGGYLVRSDAPDEGRARVVRFTRRGRAAYAKAHDILRDIEGEWSTVLGPKRFAELKELLLRVWESPLTR